MNTNDPSAQNRELMTRLWLRHQDAVYGYILAVSRNPADADDIFQNVGVVALQSDEFPAEPVRFLAWAREVARRRVLEFYRREGRVAALPPQVAQRLAEIAAESERETSSSNRRSALLICLEEMPSENRRLVSDHYGDRKLTVADLATKYGRSEQGVYSLLYRIRLLLRACIEDRLAREVSA